MPSYRGHTTLPLLLSVWVSAVQATASLGSATCGTFEKVAQLEDSSGGMKDFKEVGDSMLDFCWIDGRETLFQFPKSTTGSGKDGSVLASANSTAPEWGFDGSINFVHPKPDPLPGECVHSTRMSTGFQTMPFILIALLINFAVMICTHLGTKVISWITRNGAYIIFGLLFFVTFAFPMASNSQPDSAPLNLTQWVNATFPVYDTQGGVIRNDPMTCWLTLILLSAILTLFRGRARHARPELARSILTTFCFPLSLIGVCLGMPFAHLTRLINNRRSYAQRVVCRLFLMLDVGYFGTAWDRAADLMVVVTTCWCLVARLVIFLHLLPFTPVRDYITGEDYNTCFLAAYKFLMLMVLWCSTTLLSEVCAWFIMREVAGKRYAVPHWYAIMFGRRRNFATDWFHGAARPLVLIVHRWYLQFTVLFHEPFEHQGYFDKTTDSIAVNTAYAWARLRSGWKAVVSGKEKRMCKHTTLSFLTGYNLTGTQMVMVEELLIFVIGCSRTEDPLLLTILARNFLMRVLASSDLDARTLPELFKTLADKFEVFKTVIPNQTDANLTDQAEKLVNSQPQAFTDTLRAAAGAMAHLDTNRNVINLLTVIAGVMGVASYCDKRTPTPNFSAILEDLQKQVVNFTATTKVLDAIQSLASVLANCYESRDWSPLLFPVNPIQKWIESVKDLAVEVSNLGANMKQDIVKGLVSKLIDLDLDRDRLAPKALAVGGLIAKEFNATARTLLTTRLSLDAVQATSTLRQEPLGIILFGPPKIGKSFFTDILHIINQSAAGLNLKDTTSSYTYTGDTAFLDGLRSNVRTFILDDVGKNSPKALPMDPAIGTIIGAINTVPYQPNMASLEDKGKITFKPTLVVATTNTKHLNAAAYVNTPNAVWRRFPLVITLSVKDRFRAEGTRQLDTRKVAEAGEEALDNDLSNVWDIKVEQPVLSEQGGEPGYVLIENFTNIREFMIYLKGRLNKQAQDFSHALTAMDRVRRADRCSKCFRCISSQPCTCGSGESVSTMGLDFFLRASGVNIRNLCKVQPEIFRNFFPGKTLDEICELLFKCSIRGFMGWGIDHDYIKLHKGTLDELFEEGELIPVEVVIVVNRGKIRTHWSKLLAVMGVNFEYVLHYLTQFGVVLETWDALGVAQKPPWLSDYTIHHAAPPDVIDPPPPQMPLADQVSHALEDAGNAVATGFNQLLGIHPQMAPGSPEPAADDFEVLAQAGPATNLRERIRRSCAGVGVLDPPTHPLASRRELTRKFTDMSHMEPEAKQKHVYYSFQPSYERANELRALTARTKSFLAGEPQPEDAYPQKIEGSPWTYLGFSIGGMGLMALSSFGMFTVVGAVVSVSGIFCWWGKCLDWRWYKGAKASFAFGYNVRRLYRWCVSAHDKLVMARRVFQVTLVTAAGTLSIAAVLYLLVAFLRRAYPGLNGLPPQEVKPTTPLPEEAFEHQPFDDQVIPDAPGQANVWAANAFRVNRAIPTYSASSDFETTKRILGEHVVFMEYYTTKECTIRLCAFHGVILAKDMILTVTRDLVNAKELGARFVKLYQRDSSLVRVQYFEPSSCQTLVGETALSLVGLQTETISPLVKNWDHPNKTSSGPIAAKGYNLKSDVYMPCSYQYCKDYLKRESSLWFTGSVVSYWAPGCQPNSLAPHSQQIITSISSTKGGTCGLPLIARDTKPFMIGMHVGQAELENARGVKRLCAVSVQVDINVLKCNMHLFAKREIPRVQPGRSRVYLGDGVCVPLDDTMTHYDKGHIQEGVEPSTLGHNMRPSLGGYNDGAPRIAAAHTLCTEPNFMDPYSEKWMGDDPEGDLKITGYGTLLGSSGRPVSSGLPTTQVRSTPWRSLAEERGLTTTKVAPRFTNTMKTNGLRAMNGKLHAFPPSLVKMVGGALTQWFKIQLRNRHASCVTKAREDPVPDHAPDRIKKQREKGHLFDTTGPLSVDAAINGLGQTSCLKSLNMNSSAGYPYAAKKRNLLRREGTKWCLNPAQETELEAQRDAYKKTTRVGTIFTAAMKDEPTSQKKVDAERGRVIFGAPLEYSILVRQMFGAFMVHVMRNSDLYGCQVGVNPESARWGRTAEALKEFGKLFACDYQKYDTEAFDETMMEVTYRMMIDLNIFLNSEMFGVNKDPTSEGYKKGHTFTYDDVRVMFGLQADTINPFVLYFGQILRIAAINPSGHGLTVFLNSFGNMMLAACAYVVLQMRKEGLDTQDGSLDEFFSEVKNYPRVFKWVEQFRERVMMITYGDDFVAASKDDDFNFCTFQSIMRDHGISITAADSAKSDNVTAPFLPIEEIDFLKRGFEYDPELTAAYKLTCLQMNQQPVHDKIYRAPLRKEVVAKLFCLYMGDAEMDTERKVESLRSVWLACIQQNHDDYLRYAALLAEIAVKFGVPDDRVTFLNRSWAEANVRFYLDGDDATVDLEDPLEALSIGEDPDD